MNDGEVVVEQAVRARLGAFELQGLLGSGGMGQVWRAEHVGQRVPVAIKVIRRAGAREARLVEAFRREVQAVARLSHPNVILVLDHGLVDAEAEAASGGRLVAGSPYLAMELCGMGSVRSLPPGGTWARARAVLLGVLGALGHAHARGVVHRDVKAENILVGAPDDLRPGLKLSDFGLATGLGGDGAGWGGTPDTMAPEQCQGRARDIGPWTDLYAVGCLAWELVSGRPAFRRDTAEETIRAHVEAPAPPLEPVIAVPQELGRWVAWLLERDVPDRCRRAADAAAALRQLVVTEGRASVLVAPGVAAPDTLAATAAGETSGGTPWTGRSARGATVDAWADAAATRPSRPDVTVTRDSGDSGDLQAAGAGAPAPRRPERRDAPWGVPPMPRSWEAEEALVPPSLVGVGLGLWGLREVPVAGRVAEREALWAALSEVRLAGGTRVAVLRGASGYGKSRLAAWLCERAHELGVASVLRAAFEEDGQGDPLARMLAEPFGCVGADDLVALARVLAALRAAGEADGYAARAITEAMRGALAGGASRAGEAPGGGDAEPLVRFGAPEARLAAVAQGVELVAAERPVVLWVDDAQWGPDGIALVRQLLRRGGSAPVLAVLTVREDALAEQPATGRQLADLEGRAETSVLRLGALEPDASRELLAHALGLEGTLARDVVERARGNPLFVVQLVGDWVARGVLEPTPRGFGLRAGEGAVLPDDVHALWRARVDRLLADAPAVATALEVLALLGQEASLEEWRAAMGLEDAPAKSWHGPRTPPPDASATGKRESCHQQIRALARGRCAADSAHGVSRPIFAGVSGAVDALVDRLVALRLGDRVGADRFALAHGMLRESVVRRAREDGRVEALAAACAEAVDRGGQGDRERVGRLLALAGRHAEAAAALLEAARRAEHRGEYRRALGLLDERERALRAAGCAEDDPEWAIGCGLAASAAVNAGDFARAEAAAARVPLAARASEPGDGESCGQGEVRGAGPALAEAQQRAVFARASLLHMRGAIGEALDLYAAASEMADALGRPVAVLRCLYRIGWAQMQRGELPAARATYEGALARALALGDPVDIGNARNGLSSILCRAGDLDGALEQRRAAVEALEAVGAPNGTGVAWNGLGEIARQQGDLDGAEAAYRRAAAAYEAAGSDDRVIPRLNLALLLVRRGRARELEPLLLPELAELERRRRLDLLVSVHTLLAVASAARRAWRRFERHLSEVAACVQAGAPCTPDDAALLSRAGEAAAGAGRGALARSAFEAAARHWSAIGREAEAAEARARASEAVA